MLTYTAMGTCVLVLTLGAILVIVLVIQQEKTGKGVGTNILAALIGLLLGAGASAATVQLLGYDLAKVHQPPATDGDAPSDADPPPGGMGMGGGGMGGMMGGMMGMMGGGGPQPKRELTSVVRKIDVLTSGIALDLTSEQADMLADVLARIKTAPTMTDDEAAAFQEEIEGILTEDQLAAQEAIGLPRRRRGGGGGPGGGGPGGGGGGPGGGGGFGGDPAVEQENPFLQDTNAAALENLVKRFTGEAGEAESTPEATAEDAESESAPAAEETSEEESPAAEEPTSEERTEAPAAAASDSE